MNKANFIGRLIILVGVPWSIFSQTTQPIIYKALTDFAIIKATTGTAEYYTEPTRGCFAIDATNPAYRQKFAAATTVFKGTSGKYDLKLTALQELDGETNHKIYVQGKQVGGTLQNDRIFGTSLPDYSPKIHTLTNILLNSGDTIRVESDVHSNSLMHEGGVVKTPPVWAWARGRWTQIELIPAGNVPLENPSSSQINKFSIQFFPGTSVISFRFPMDRAGWLNIYTHQGTLVFSGSTQQGVLFWNKQNLSGKKVVSGLYSATYYQSGKQFSQNFFVP